MLMAVLSVNLFADVKFSKEENDQMFNTQIKKIKLENNFPQKVDDHIYWIDLYANNKGALVYEYQIVKNLNQTQIKEYNKHLNSTLLSAYCNDKSIYEVIMVRNKRDINIIYRYEGENLAFIKVNKEICKKYRK
ncbi:hypothetical protein QT384_11175 (plasmid) [Arcobacter cryaerophilus gv. pseudocryaerophilus]|uniref:Uncharacterized protein n=3 Tax=Arcobacteraceae TaxID=2808963 RepID=A0AA96DVT1_9BACT|nr:hypothetical protein RMP68_11175 [Arcobacter sp. AZ-2023]WNL37292.1 hypothetical protein RMQ66_11175 [Arcobacter sp. AZ-2023]WPD13008.1 hypothetical protein QT384_11175 [Arcobacter sp. DSM 115960]